jgi:G3E family GTPase
MTEKTDVYLITGFLGAGKTTLLNRIIKRFPPDKKLTLLVNEFGEVGVDGTLVEGEDIDMMEISKGSIFCVCVKTDFIKGLYELSGTVKPDVLLIESTGVANPSDLKRDLQLPIFDGRFHFKEQFCVIDAAHFIDAYQVYASLEKQIASSTVFIVNKTDLATAQRLEETKEVIRQFHPDPQFFETTYGDIPLDRFFEIDMASGEKASGPSGPLEKAALTEEELDRFIDDLLDSPDLEITPPDVLVSAAYRWNGGDIGEIRKLADRLPEGVVRAKGFVEENGATFLFNYVMGHWTLEPPTIDPARVQHKNVLVFIGPPEVIQTLEPLATEDSWESLGTYQPF